MAGRGALVTGAASGIGKATAEAEWDRRLHAAVPLGMDQDLARSLMRRNGFHCEPQPSGLTCDKWSNGQVVRRHWLPSCKCPTAA